MLRRPGTTRASRAQAAAYGGRQYQEIYRRLCRRAGAGGADERAIGRRADGRRVDAELSFDLLIDPAGITVRNIDGNVALNGTAPS
jgi:hypothetical protein